MDPYSRFDREFYEVHGHYPRVKPRPAPEIAVETVISHRAHHTPPAPPKLFWVLLAVWSLFALLILLPIVIGMVGLGVALFAGLLGL